MLRILPTPHNWPNTNSHFLCKSRIYTENANVKDFTKASQLA